MIISKREMCEVKFESPALKRNQLLYSNLSPAVLLLVSSCLACNYCWLAVCIVVVVLCVLLSYVYLLYYVGIAVFYFRCSTAG